MMSSLVLIWLRTSTHGFHSVVVDYWNHSSGKKWTNDGEWKVLPYDRTEKRFYDSSLIFKRY